MPDRPEHPLTAHPLINPLSDEDRIALEQIIQKQHAIHDLLNRAEASGVDLGDRRARHEMHGAIAQRLHTHFFPKQLPAVHE